MLLLPVPLLRSARGSLELACGGFTRGGGSRPAPDPLRPASECECQCGPEIKRQTSFAACHGAHSMTTGVESDAGAEHHRSFGWERGSGGSDGARLRGPTKRSATTILF